MEKTGFHLLTVKERLLRRLPGCDHNWSFPQTLREKSWQEIYAANEPFDSHQQCPKCGAMRLFNFVTMEAGPMFTREPRRNG